MSTEIKGCAEFSCTHCSKKYLINSSDIEFSAEENIDFDDEITRFGSEIRLKCGDCGSSLSVSLEVWEFPIGAVNYQYYGESGISDVNCEFDISYHSDSDEDDFATALYLD